MLRYSLLRVPRGRMFNAVVPTVRHVSSNLPMHSRAAVCGSRMSSMQIFRQSFIQGHHRGSILSRRTVSSYPTKVKLPGFGEGSSPFKKGLPIAIGAIVFLAGCVGVAYLYVKYVYKPQFSSIYLGEPKQVDLLLSLEFGLDMRFVLPKMTCGLMAMALGDPLKEIGYEETVVKQARKAFQSILLAYPDHFIGYALLGWLERSLGNLKEAKRLLHQARSVATLYPGHNQGMKFLLPEESDFKARLTEQEVDSYTTVIKVTNNVWAVGAPFVDRSSSIQDPVWIQATVVRQQNGDVVIVNPTYFSAETVQFINSIGTVKTLISTTAHHSKAIQDCSERLWTEAEVFGTDPTTRHWNLAIQWDGFVGEGVLDKEGHQLSEHPLTNEFEFKYVQSKGLCEVGVFHKPSRVLSGITDTLICPEKHAERRYQGWGKRALLFALGVERGTRSHPLVPHSANALFCSDVRKNPLGHNIRMWKCKHIVVGHGGLFHGFQTCVENLTRGFLWSRMFLDRRLQPQEFLALMVRWIYEAQLTTFFMRRAGAVAAATRRDQQKKE